MMVLLLSSVPAPQHKLHGAAPFKPGHGQSVDDTITFGTPNLLSEVRCPGGGIASVAPDLPSGDTQRGAEDPAGAHPGTHSLPGATPPFYTCTPDQRAASGSIPSACDFGKFNPTNPLQFTKISLVMEVHHTTRAKFVFSVF